MADVKDCIDKMVSAGKITKVLADEAKAFFDRSRAEFSVQAGPASADAAAAVQTAKMMKDKAAARQLEIATTVKAFHEGERRVLEDPRGRNAALAGMLSKDTLIGDNRLKKLLKSDPEHPIFRGGNADYKAMAIKDKLYAMLGPELEKLKTGFLTDINKLNSARNFIRERFGVDTGDTVAKSLSDGFGKLIDYGTARAKAAGRVFKELENWRVFQHWSPDRVAQFTEAEYVRDHMAQIANGGMKLFDKETGRYAAASRYEELLRKAYSDIKTEGSATAPFSKDARTFQFQPGEVGAKAWLALQAKYGVGNEIMGAVGQHIEHMARTIALHEQFGGNPDAVFAALLRLVKADPSKPIKGLGWTTSAHALKNTYDTISGRGRPVANETLARIMSGARQVVGLSSLRNLPITIIPGDSAMTLMASKFLGMDGFKVLGEIGSLTKDEARHLQVQAGGYSDFINNAYRQYENQINVSGLVRKVSRGVVRATGADLWTTNGRQGWQAAMLNFLTAQSGKAFDKLPEAFRDHFMGYYGFTPAEWDTIRQSAPFVVGNGAKYLDPNALPEKLSERLMAAIKEQGSYAFHQPDARTQALMRQGAKAGTLPGEAWLSMGQYKQFTMERMTTHLMRSLVDGPLENRIARGSAFVILSMAAGAVSLQTAAILAGKDPLDMASPKFWAQAFAKGGAGGLWGDMLGSALFGGRDAASMLGQMAGPVPGFISDTAQLATAPAQKEIEELEPGARPSKKGAEQTFEDRLYGMGRRWTPSTWYTKAATDRLLWDKLQMLADPDYRKSFRRLEKRAQTEGSGYFFPPGESMPTRAPNFRTAIGQQ